MIEVGSRRGFSRFPEVKPATSDGPSGWNWRQQNASRFPEIKGRVSRLKDGRIGRFGWKGQTASLEDFVLTACAVELGLEVPGHHQAGLPIASKSAAAAPGLDLGPRTVPTWSRISGASPRRPCGTARIVARDRRPIRRGGVRSDRLRGVPQAQAGRCQRPLQRPPPARHGRRPRRHGVVQHLHPRFPPSDSSDESPLDEPTGSVARAKTGERRPAAKTRQEWRTPPLWGVQTPAPYMHDGRAGPSSTPSSCTAVRPRPRSGATPSSMRANAPRSSDSLNRWSCPGPAERRRSSGSANSCSTPIDDKRPAARSQPRAAATRPTAKIGGTARGSSSLAQNIDRERMPE